VKSGFLVRRPLHAEELPFAGGVLLPWLGERDDCIIVPLPDLPVLEIKAADVQILEQGAPLGLEELALNTLTRRSACAVEQAVLLRLEELVVAGHDDGSQRERVEHVHVDFVHA
jgi:hypothetical protein